ncbi:MAG: hypothetical protein KAR22_07900 [Gammaproteobacteria bacterium]|nr:hypothetical protein [Gammaproteobacteria bacterium]
MTRNLCQPFCSERVRPKRLRLLPLLRSLYRGEAEDLLLLGGSPEEQEEFAHAIIGVTVREGFPVVVYDREKVIQVYIDRDGMSREDAEEFYEFNVDGAYVGPKTPIYVDTDMVLR